VWTWRGGGVGSVLTTGTFERNDVHDNRGAGLFLVRNDGLLVTGNTVHDNWGAGVILHHGRGATVENNRLWRNGWRARPREPAIFVMGAQDAEIRENTLAFHSFGIRVLPPSGPSSDLCASVQHWIAANVLIASGDERSALSVDQALSSCAPPRAEHNRLYARLSQDEQSLVSTLVALP
jgi:parallel beta-helix repeat protein